MNKTNQKSNDELGALWKKKSKNGMAFLSGYVKVDELGVEKEVKVVVFANNNKSNEKAPDYRIYISRPLDSNEPSEKTIKSNTIKNVKTQKESEEEDLL